MSRAITEADVREAATAGRTVAVPKGAVVTPAARDLARSLGVSLRETAAGQAHRPVVAVGADHGGYQLKEQLKPVLAQAGYEVLDLGTNDAQPVDYLIKLSNSFIKSARGIYLGPCFGTR